MFTIAFFKASTERALRAGAASLSSLLAETTDDKLERML